MALTQSALLAQGWAGLWSLTGGSFPASLVSFEWSVHVGVVTLGAIVSREWGHVTGLSLLCRVTLDTPVNRKSMPEADFSSWTPLEFLVE